MWGKKIRGGGMWINKHTSLTVGEMKLHKHEWSSPAKSVMDVVASETQEHLATLHSWGRKKKEGSKFMATFLSETSGKQMALVPNKVP